MDNPLKNLNGLAMTLHVPRAWLRDEARAGRIPSLRIGRRYMFNIDAVSRALADRAAETPEKGAAPCKP